MFAMCAMVVFDGVRGSVPVTSMKWSRKIHNLYDSAVIELPLRVVLKNQFEEYKDVLIKEGMKVTIDAGYNTKNERRFMGFVLRIDYATPLQIHCVGYAYQLRRVIFNKSYANTTVKEILEDLIKGTDIKLSPEIPHIPLEKETFTKY